MATMNNCVTFIKPARKCYVISHPHLDYYYTIEKRMSRSILAFTCKKRAQTFERLLREMDYSKNTKYKFRVRDIPYDFFITNCTQSGLGVLLFNDKGCDDIEPAKEINEDFIFALENKYKYH